MVKLNKTFEIKSNNNKLLLRTFFAYVSHFPNTLKIAENYAIWLSSKAIFIFCVIYETKVIHAITSSFFKFRGFLQKHADVSKILGNNRSIF